MQINYMVYTKVAAHSPWKFTGIIESDKVVADKVWSDITQRLRHYAYKLEYCTWGIQIERTGK